MRGANDNGFYDLPIPTKYCVPPAHLTLLVGSLALMALPVPVLMVLLLHAVASPWVGGLGWFAWNTLSQITLMVTMIIVTGGARVWTSLARYQPLQRFVTRAAILCALVNAVVAAGASWGSALPLGLEGRSRWAAAVVGVRDLVFLPCVTVVLAAINLHRLQESWRDYFFSWTRRTAMQPFAPVVSDEGLGEESADMQHGGDGDDGDDSVGESPRSGDGDDDGGDVMLQDSQPVADDGELEPTVYNPMQGTIMSASRVRAAAASHGMARRRAQLHDVRGDGGGDGAGSDGGTDGPPDHGRCAMQASPPASQRAVDSPRNGDASSFAGDSQAGSIGFDASEYDMGASGPVPVQDIDAYRSQPVQPEALAACHGGAGRPVVAATPWLGAGSGRGVAVNGGYGSPQSHHDSPQSHPMYARVQEHYQVVHGDMQQPHAAYSGVEGGVMHIGHGAATTGHAMAGGTHGEAHMPQQAVGGQYGGGERGYHPDDGWAGGNRIRRAPEGDGSHQSMQRDGMVYEVDRRGSHQSMQRSGMVYEVDRRGSHQSMQRDGMVYEVDRRGSHQSMQRDGRVYEVDGRGSHQSMQRDGMVYEVDRRGSRRSVAHNGGRSTYEGPYVQDHVRELHGPQNAAGFGQGGSYVDGRATAGYTQQRQPVVPLPAHEAEPGVQFTANVPRPPDIPPRPEGVRRRYNPHPPRLSSRDADHRDVDDGSRVAADANDTMEVVLADKKATASWSRVDAWKQYGEARRLFHIPEQQPPSVQSIDAAPCRLSTVLHLLLALLVVQALLGAAAVAGVFPVHVMYTGAGVFALSSVPVIALWDMHSQRCLRRDLGWSMAMQVLLWLLPSAGTSGLAWLLSTAAPWGGDVQMTAALVCLRCVDFALTPIARFAAPWRLYLPLTVVWQAFEQSFLCLVLLRASNLVELTRMLVVKAVFQVAVDTSVSSIKGWKASPPGSEPRMEVGFNLREDITRVFEKFTQSALCQLAAPILLLQTVICDHLLPGTEVTAALSPATAGQLVVHLLYVVVATAAVLAVVGPWLQEAARRAVEPRLSVLPELSQVARSHLQKHAWLLGTVLMRSYWELLFRLIQLNHQGSF